MSRRDDKKPRPKPQKARPGGIAVTALCCVMGVPTCVQLLPGIAGELAAAVEAGVLLAIGYLLLRPILKLLTLPIGCLTLGLTNFAIDVGLLYLSAYLIEGFTIESVVSAALTAFLINAISAVAGGFK